jgi:hypothetical protein
MKYMHNQRWTEEGLFIIYPETWFDAIRCILAGILIPGLKRTWKNNPYWYKLHVAGCVDVKTENTEYPDTCGAG